MLNALRSCPWMEKIRENLRNLRFKKVGITNYPIKRRKAI